MLCQKVLCMRGEQACGFAVVRKRGVERRDDALARRAVHALRNTAGEAAAGAADVRAALVRHGERCCERAVTVSVFGTEEPGTPPHCCVVVCASACAFTYCSSASTSPLRQDCAEIANATSPTTCGPAMLVPLKRA